ncbi:ArnT family glycosyltransferase [Candidatus Omnitrophota bacterium]
MFKKVNPLVIILAVALIIRVWGINHNFPDVNRYFYETEEHSSIQIAMGFGGGDLNPHSFNKPTLLYYLLFIFYGGFYLLGKLVGLFAGVADFVRFYFYNTWVFYLIGRIFSVILGLGSIFLLYLTGKKVFSKKSGLVAAAMLAVAPLHVEFSQLALTDILGLFLAMFAIYYALRANQDFSLNNVAASGFFSGLAMSAKYHYGFCVLALALVMLLQLIKAKSWSGSFFKKAFAGWGCLITGFVFGTPFAVLDHKYFLASILELQRAKAGAGLEILSQRHLIPNWWIEHIFQLADKNALGIGLLAVSLSGVIFAAWRHRRKDIVLLAIIVFFYSFFSISKWHWSPAHYLLLIVPYSLLLGAELIVKLFSKFKPGSPWPAALLSLILIPPFLTAGINDNLRSRPDTKARAKQWIEANIPAGARILMDKIYVPQLSLTKESLKMLTDMRLANQSILLPTYREIKSKNKYADLRDQSLTQRGTPYNIYTIERDAVMNIAEYKQKYNIEYVIISSLAKNSYINVVPFNINKETMSEFYKSVENNCTLIREFLPNSINLLGPSRIEIYKVN